MKPDIYPVKKIKNGSLSVMAKPVSGEWIEDEFAGIASYGINILVSLLEKEESKELGLENEQKHCHKNDINFISYPIKDRGVPNSVTHFVKLIHYLFNEISAGKNIVIHCRAGR
ncbi:protein tyrosine phosphatase [Alteromonadaceae bacterium M269]|nr:protein tyrosine phosphatase [Alteromonadaceae bacterium M269]